MKNVLVICMGNICRSPTADGVLRHKLAEAGLADAVRVDSAGTHGYHAGHEPDKRSQAEAVKRGYDLSDIRSRRVTEDDFHEFDLILAMDEDNLAHLRDMAPAESRATLALFLDYHSARQGEEVPDPYYGGRAGFAHVLDLIEDAAAGLVTELQQR